MARPNGVVIASERFWAFATTDGALHVGPTPARPSLLRHVPLVRGLARIAAAMAPLFRGRGVAGRRERWILALVLIVPFTFFLLPEPVELAGGIAVMLFM